MQSIAVIGGGAAGAAVFGELLRIGNPVTKYWITGPDPQGRGVAYATRDERHLLNVRASGMGVFADDDGEFVRFARRELPDAQATDFLSRRLFGDYVQFQVETAIERARTDQQPVHVTPAIALRLQARSDSGFRIELSDDTRLDVDAAVLALGVPPPRPLPGITGEALVSGRFCRDPWRLGELEITPRRIAVLGTGLTGVDAILSASARWPEAHVLAISRHGRFPMTHPPLPAERYASQSELNAALLACRRVSAMFRLIRAYIDEEGRDAATVVEGMRPINVRLWQRLSQRERIRFLRHLRSLWDRTRHRSPPVSMAGLRALQYAGRLHIQAAHIEGVYGEGPLTVSMRQNGQVRQEMADVVIQATGLNLSVPHSQNPLLLHLLHAGIVQCDPLGLGFQATTDHRVVSSDGNAWQHLYALGPLLVGTFWECIAMPEIRVTARQIAESLSSPVL